MHARVGAHRLAQLAHLRALSTRQTQAQGLHSRQRTGARDSPDLQRVRRILKRLLHLPRPKLAQVAAALGAAAVRLPRGQLREARLAKGQLRAQGLDLLQRLLLRRSQRPEALLGSGWLTSSESVIFAAVSTLVRVTVGSFHELGRRESRCLTSRCDARTVCLRSMRSSLWRLFTPAPAMQNSRQQLAALPRLRTRKLVPLIAPVCCPKMGTGR